MKTKTKTTATKEEATPALLPKLRFPEFREAEGWRSKTLGQMGTFIRGLTYTPGDVADNGLLVLRSGNIQDDSLVFDKDLVFVGKTCNPDLLLKGGDVVICMSNGSKALVGKSGEYRQDYGGEVTIGAFCSLYRAKDPFSKIAFRSEQYSDFIADSIMGGNINNLKNSTLEGFPFPIPPSDAEQQKIASCLSSVDELMAAQARKVDALKTHKKGLMQQLFPREGETQPRLRFPEFQNAGEWEVKRVDEQGSVLAGKALAVNAPGPQRPYLRTKNVLDGAIDLSDVLTMPMTDAEFIRFEILDGDVLLNEGQSLELVGRASMYNREFGQRCAMQNALLRFRAFPSTSAEFASQYFRQYQKDGTFANVATKTTSVAHLGSSRFSALELAWPTPAEQQRIATCLSSLDALITAETQKHEALKTHKKGLMQRLFPSPEEVEG